MNLITFKHSKKSSRYNVYVNGKLIWKYKTIEGFLKRVDILRSLAVFDELSLISNDAINHKIFRCWLTGKAWKLGENITFTHLCWSALEQLETGEWDGVANG